MDVALRVQACAFSVGLCQSAFSRLNQRIAELQSNHGVAPSRGDENMDTYNCEQNKRFRQL